jgi:tRNA pseudouridine38-40 synthase
MLDVEAMRAAAAHMIGEMDFSAFRASGCTAKTATREVTEIAVLAQEDEIWFEVRGNAFLRNMVRIMVGTLVRVGGGRMDPSQVVEILESRDRTRAGQTAPARGLALVEVYYGQRR